MTETDEILVIIDPTAKEQPALDRAAWLGKALGSRLDLFICDYDQYLAGERFFDSSALEKARIEFVDAHRKRLDAMRKRLEGEGFEVEVDARWDHPLHKGIMRKVNDVNPCIVVKDTHYHSALKRALLSNTDWNLIRDCPAPLLLVKPRATRTPVTVIAAVDPTHQHDKPASLDQAIMALATRLAAALGGTLHVFHAFDPAPALALGAGAMANPVSIPVKELTEILETRHAEALGRLLAAHSVPKSNVHMLQGQAHDLLIRTAEDLEADIVVMGAVARSGLKHAFIGSTAERVLDRLSCDLLVVKS